MASTISGNGEGFEWIVVTNEVFVAGTIVSNNSGKDCAFSSDAIIDAGYNIDGTCRLTATTSHSDVNPALGPLTYNGGPTETMTPRWGSIAINQIPVGDRGDARGVRGAFLAVSWLVQQY
jgi:hypothetical protein